MKTNIDELISLSGNNVFNPNKYLHDWEGQSIFIIC